MSEGESGKTIGLQILHVHTEECGDGSCGCGCGDIPTAAVTVGEKPTQSAECCEPVCGPETCG